MELRDETGRAVVHLEIDNTANGERLTITSALTGDTRLVDALMLEALTWMPGSILDGPSEHGREA
jgi:hypothetical protein